MVVTVATVRTGAMAGRAALPARLDPEGGWAGDRAVTAPRAWVVRPGRVVRGGTAGTRSTGGFGTLTRGDGLGGTAGTGCNPGAPG